MPHLDPSNRALDHGPRRLVPAVALLVAVGLAALVGAGCSDDDPTAGAASSSSTSETTTTIPTTTAPPPLFFPTGEEAMEHLAQAWKAGDQVEATRGAAPEAVASLFATPSEGYAKYGACGSAEFGQQLCTYRNRSAGGFIQFQMAQVPEGWMVEMVTVDQGG
jgi:hypothetical protein